MQLFYSSYYVNKPYVDKEKYKIIQLPVLVQVNKHFFTFVVDPTDPKIKYEWTDVGVLDYDPEENLYFVQKCNSAGRIVDESGNAVVNGGFNADGKIFLFYRC